MEKCLTRLETIGENASAGDFSRRKMLTCSVSMNRAQDIAKLEANGRRIFNSAHMERIRVIRPLSKPQHTDNELFPKPTSVRQWRMTAITTY
jgi:hypothetical protein